MDLFYKMKELISGIKNRVSEGRRKARKTAELRGQIKTCENLIRKNYLELGMRYYEKFGDCPDPELEKQCRNIKNAKNGAKELRKKLKLTKAMNA